MRFEIEITREDLNKIKETYGYNDDVGAIEWCLYNSVDVNIDPKIVVGSEE